MKLRGVEQISDCHESISDEVNEVLPASLRGLHELQLQGSAIGQKQRVMQLLQWQAGVKIGE